MDPARSSLDDPQRRLATLLSNLSGMAYRCRADAARTMEFVSDGCVEITGYTVDELTHGEHRAFARLIAPFNRQGVELSIHAAIAAGAPYSIEYQLVHRSGRLRHLSERGRCVGHDDGVALLEGYIADISALKSTHFDLGERVKELRLLYEVTELCSSGKALDDVLWTCLERIPPAYCYPVEVAARLVVDDRDYRAPRYYARQGAPRQTAAILAHGAPIGEIEVVRVSGDGADASYFLPEEQAMLSAVADRLGGFIERERILAALRSSERKARALYEHLPVPTVVWQRQGDDFVLLEHNAAARVATDGRVASYVGATARALLASHPELLEAAERCLTERTSQHRDARYALGDGRVASLSLSFGLVPPDLVLVHVADVSAERKLQERLHHAQKMEVLGRMAAGVAHDFNNLLTVIVSYTELLLQRTSASDASRSDLNEIRNAVERAAALTRQLTTFSRHEVLRPRSVDLNRQIRGIERMLATLLGSDRSLALALSEESCPIEIHPSHADQVLFNLVANARDATSPGGRVTISTRVVEVDAELARTLVDLSPGVFVLLSVQDDGSGMDAATQARVFEPFFTTKAVGNGTGMGLATVYGIVRQCAGSISVTSEAGHGARFSLYFPKAGAVRLSAPVREVRVQPARTGETVLVVEDNESIRKLVQRVLTEAGYRVLIAENGAEARVLCERHREGIDLLLTDIVLPWQSGPELAAELPRIVPALRVLFMSGYAERAANLKVDLEPGMNFLAKPFTAEHLTRMVREVLDKPLALPPER